MSSFCYRTQENTCIYVYKICVYKYLHRYVSVSEQRYTFIFLYMCIGDIYYVYSDIQGTLEAYIPKQPQETGWYRRSRSEMS